MKNVKVNHCIERYKRKNLNPKFYNVYNQPLNLLDIVVTYQNNGNNLVKEIKITIPLKNMTSKK